MEIKEKNEKIYPYSFVFLFVVFACGLQRGRYGKFVCGLLFAYGRRCAEIYPAKGKNFESFENGRNVIVCFGDSITYGDGAADGYFWPQQLETNLNGQYDVLNAGICAEKGNAILSRANACDFYLTNDAVFAAGQDRVTFSREIFSATNDNKPIQYLGFGNELPQDRVIINSESYDIIYTETDKYQFADYTLVRKGDTSKPLTIPKGTPVKYDYSSHFDSCEVAIINFGVNDNDTGSEKLIEKYKEFTRRYEKYIILVPCSNDRREQMFIDAFGENAVVMRQEMLKEGFMEKYGNSAVGDTAMNLLNAESVRYKSVPACFRKNNNRKDVHFNALGNKAIADLLYERGVELGYWK